MVQVYAARTVGWRGYVSVHSWVTVKPAGASAFTVYELMGYQTRRTGNGVRVSQRHADGYWYGNPPHVVADARGPGAEPLVDRIRAAADDYPHAAAYFAWPGPNSNTFIAHLLRAVPELRVDLPAHAIGKDYLGASLVKGTAFSMYPAAKYGVENQPPAICLRAPSCVGAKMLRADS